ncbi:hypothetical protein [Agromyces sp. GXS1127]|uniref:hypothetical protein n=1 Tax=Agromyces sp. GXS1127 TaxID=3424181 RepID=UPI003D31E481
MLEEVSLVGADGLELVEASLVAITDQTAVGVSFPGTDPPAGWGDRVPAVGTPIPAGTTVNLVVTVAAPNGVGKAESVNVEYNDGRGASSLSGTTRYRLAGVCG